jgi:DNA-binding NtrC family response regulator
MVRTMPETFLIIDDDEDGRFLTRRLLEKSFTGCTVLEAADCDSALRQSSGVPISVVLSDHHLRGTSGPRCITLLRERGVTAPVLIITGSDDPRDYAAAIAAGALRVVRPNDRMLIQHVHAVLGR